MRILIAVLLGMCMAGGAHAKTNLGLPRYVSLKSTDANLRTGPGLRYQIKWVMKRPGIPLEVIAEFEQWRKVRDIEGDEGWLHSSMLSNRRTTLLLGAQVLRRSAAAGSEPIAKIEQGVHAELLECTREFCRIKKGEHKGWVERAAVWGVYPEEWAEE